MSGDVAMRELGRQLPVPEFDSMRIPDEITAALAARTDDPVDSAISDSDTP